MDFRHRTDGPPSRPAGNIDAVKSEAPLPQSQPARPLRNPALDGLRGIAVLAVMAYHLWPEQLPGGFLGVDLFFVLSGFLITSGLLKHRGAPALRGLGGFWVRRARRLLPAMLLMLLGATALALAAGPNLPANLRAQWIGALTYTSNWMQIASGTSYFTAADPPYFQHLWSLAVEEQFYLIWPLALLLLGLLAASRRRLTVCILLLACASAATMALLYDPAEDTSMLYFGTWTHGFGLFFGAAAAAWADGRPAKPWGRSRGMRQLVPALLFGLMLCAIALLPDTSAAAYRGGMALFAAAAALLLLVLGAPGSGVYRLLGVQPLRWVGNRSYGLYLWHWPLLLLCKMVFPATAPSAAVLCAIPLTFLAAAASWHFVEQRILADGFKATLRRWGSGALQAAGALFSGQRRMVPAALAMSLAMMVPVGIVMVLANSPVQTQLEQQLAAAQQELAGQQLEKRPEPVQPDSAQSESVQPSDSGQPASREKEHAKKHGYRGRDVVALGDSVMLASSPQLLKALPGIFIDARVGAQVWDVLPKLRAMKQAGTLRPVVVLGLGTNGDFQDSALEQIRRAIGPRRELLLVTAYAPRSWVDSVNQKYRQAEAEQKHTHVVDWADVAPGVDDLAPDRIHPGPHGGAKYAKLLKDAVKEL
ncbi:acyltransferase [Glutamicibacter uratoxydans]|uniref:Acyltransferase n=1 Tax=Glutamicibacter uratoxydans TaxID=43667 RepID=A0A4Y4DN71_GLUUR|nr:acyltransferase [Glutamicibacter uratoxydans]